ncbi:MAG TPA: hypothetical protein VGN72_15815 [Tepidisphaeraceae bacterium]|jgi:hypothetical protein|nr:hypothetical protein [Tepidisphaeraceae bacterium]
MPTKTKQAILADLLLAPCTTPAALHLWVRVFLQMNVPTTPVCPHHDAPFEYLKHAYFEPAKDVVVWAPRGGGKTRLGAAATLLDLLHKPGVAVRILGGSVEQSLKMWEHLLPDLERVAGGMLLGKTRLRRIGLSNGSAAAVLTQSQRAVRGLRVQKLRCDEVELFDPAVWEAAQLVTRSMNVLPDGQRRRRIRRAQHQQVGNAANPASPSEIGAREIGGVVEALSTLHAPYGLMNRVVESAQASGTRVIRWCVLDVLERCPPSRPCGTCPLWDECQGVAKTKCNGFMRIDDAIAMKRRVSTETWQAEMLCRRPSVKGCVFPSFDPSVHVREAGPLPVVSGAVLSDTAHSGRSVATDNGRRTTDIRLAIDFGYANPFVCLWIATHDCVTHVVDEYVQTQRTVDEHVAHLASRPWPVGRGTLVACDPAGNGRSEQTGRSSVDALRAAGYVVRSRPSRIVDGLELVRAALRPASGAAALFIHPRCTRLIKAMRSYHYPPCGGELPVKDGEHDHLIDALRYHFVNASVCQTVVERRRY